MKKINVLLMVAFCSLALFLTACQMNVSQWWPDNGSDARYSVKAGQGLEVLVQLAEADSIDLQCSDKLRPFIKVQKLEETYVVEWDFDKLKEVYGDDDRFQAWGGASINNKEVVLKGIPFPKDSLLVKLYLKEVRGLCAATNAHIEGRGLAYSGNFSLGSHSSGQVILRDSLRAKSLSVECSSGSYAEGFFALDNGAELELSSGAEAELAFNCTMLKLEGSSGSSVKLRGAVDKLFINLSSGAKANVKGLIYEELSKSISSGASMR